jgi:hypothetical protein
LGEDQTRPVGATDCATLNSAFAFLYSFQFEEYFSTAPADSPVDSATAATSDIHRRYPDDSLAHIPQYWIMNEARQCGLRFKSTPDADPDSMINTKAAWDKDGRLYDSRSGLGSYYRYGPRKLAELCDEKLSNKPGDAVLIRLPKIHESVLKRIQNNAHPLRAARHSRQI